MSMLYSLRLNGTGEVLNKREIPSPSRPNIASLDRQYQFRASRIFSIIQIALALKFFFFFKKKKDKLSNSGILSTKEMNIWSSQEQVDLMF
jgi:hypothetical protein